MTRERPGVNKRLPTVPAGSAVRLAADGRPGTVVLVRRRKWARRYGVDIGTARPILLRRAEFVA